MNAVLDKCKGCDRLMRPAHARAEDWPGTIGRLNADLCQTCYRKQWVVSREMLGDPLWSEHERTPERDKQWYADFVAERRRRGVPSEGYRMPGELPDRDLDRCFRGHEFTEENTYWHIVRGKRNRECRTCRKARNVARNERRRQAKAAGKATPAKPRTTPKPVKAPKPPKPLATHCGNGHEYTPENTRIEPGGRRRCRKCASEHMARTRAKSRVLELVGA